MRSGYYEHSKISINLENIGSRLGPIQRAYSRDGLEACSDGIKDLQEEIRTVCNIANLLQPVWIVFADCRISQGWCEPPKIICRPSTRFFPMLHDFGEIIGVRLPLQVSVIACSYWKAICLSRYLATLNDWRSLKNGVSELDLEVCKPHVLRKLEVCNWVSKMAKALRAISVVGGDGPLEDSLKGTHQVIQSMVYDTRKSLL